MINWQGPRESQNCCRVDSPNVPPARPPRSMSEGDRVEPYRKDPYHRLSLRPGSCASDVAQYPEHRRWRWKEARLIAQCARAASLYRTFGTYIVTSCCQSEWLPFLTQLWCCRTLPSFNRSCLRGEGNDDQGTFTPSIPSTYSYIFWRFLWVQRQMCTRSLRAGLANLPPADFDHASCEILLGLVGHHTF